MFISRLKPRMQALIGLLIVTVMGAVVWIVVIRSGASEPGVAYEADGKTNVVYTWSHDLDPFGLSEIYIWPYESFSDLLFGSNLIVSGSVLTAGEKSEYVEEIDFEIEEVLGGFYDATTLTIYQTKDYRNDVFNEKGSFILFLGKHDDGEDYNYYILGGHQGIFYESDGKLAGVGSLANMMLHELEYPTLNGLKDYIVENMPSQ